MLNVAVIVINMVALGLGLVVYVLSVIVYSRNRDVMIGYYIIIQSIIMLFMFFAGIFAFVFYDKNFVLNWESGVLARLFYIIRSAFIFLIPLFYHSVFRPSRLSTRNWIFGIAALINIGLVCSPFFMNYETQRVLWGYALLKVSVYLTLAYSYRLIIRNLSKVENNRIVFMMKIFMLLLSFHVLFLVAEDIFLLKGIMHPIFLWSMLLNPILYFIWSVFFIWFIMGYFRFSPIHINREMMVASLSDLDQHKVTEREKEIIALLLEGYSKKEVAKKLFISEFTVKTHIQNIYIKLDVKNRVELVNYIKDHQTAV